MNLIQKLRSRIPKSVIIIVGVLVGILLILSLPTLCFVLLILRVKYGIATQGSQYASCEKYISETNGVQIIARKDHTEFLEGGAFSFAATTDGGQTWVEFMNFRHDDPIEPPCENIRSLDEQHFWVWMGWQLGITHDGGATWQTWSPTDTWPDWQCCHYRMITNVDFEDPLQGYMQLTPIRVPTSELYSTDGGQTWVEKLE